MAWFASKLAQALVITLAMLSGCATSPPHKAYSDKANAFGLTEREIGSEPFSLTVFENQKPLGKYLHVYLEGDGVPFIRRRFINPDPTSKAAIALTMLSKDPNKSVLIGRPCYHKKARAQVVQPLCKNNQWWTSHRYSQEVVESLRSAIEQINAERVPIRLIGYSGGGSLATLLASSLKQRTELVTVSANLDIDAWARKNNFTPLYGSMNPIELLGKVSERGTQLTHFVGKEDATLFYSSWLNLIQDQANSKVIIMPLFSHSCCWAENWEALLQEHFPN